MALTITHTPGDEHSSAFTDALYAAARNTLADDQPAQATLLVDTGAGILAPRYGQITELTVEAVGLSFNDEVDTIPLASITRLDLF